MAGLPTAGNPQAMEDDTGSVWSEVHRDELVDGLQRKITELQHEQSMLRNQVHVMAAFAQQPVGQHVHAKARVLQSTVRRYLLHKKYATLRKASVKMQSAYRRHKQQVKFVKMLCTFPERTKSALLVRALNEKKRADALEDRLAEAQELNKSFSKCLVSIECSLYPTGGLSNQVRKQIELCRKETAVANALFSMEAINDPVQCEEEEDMGFDLFD